MSYLHVRQPYCCAAAAASAELTEVRILLQKTVKMPTAFKRSCAVGDQGAAASEMGQDAGSAGSAGMRSTMGPSTARPGRRRIKVSLGGAWMAAGQGRVGGGRGGGG